MSVLCMSYLAKPRTANTAATQQLLMTPVLEMELSPMPLEID